MTQEVNQSRPRSNSDVGSLLRRMVEIEKLIQRYKTESVRKSQSVPNLNDTPVVEMLMSKKSETDAVVQRMQKSEQDTISQWWRLRRPELDTIIEHWRNNDAELERLKHVQQTSRESHQNNYLTRFPTGRRRLHSCPAYAASSRTQSQ